MRRPRRVLSTPVPPAIRRAGLSYAAPHSGHDIGLLLCPRTKPRATACCPLHVRLNRQGPRGFPHAAASMAVVESPPFACDRDVAPGALAARRPHCRAIAARHIRHRPVPSHARHLVRQRPRKAASEHDGLYHAIINPASLACLADPLLHKAPTPLQPPVTTPARRPPAPPATGVVTGGMCPVRHPHIAFFGNNPGSQDSLPIDSHAPT